MKSAERRAAARGIALSLLLMLGACATTAVAGRAHMTKLYLYVADYDIDRVSVYCNGWKLQEFKSPPSLDGQSFWVRMGQCNLFTASARGIAGQPIWASSPIPISSGQPTCVRVASKQVHIAQGPVCVRR